jgi:hypothetical protein
MNPFLRPLFKPILNKAARQAYKMTGTAQDFATRAADRVKPYAKNYMDAAAGNQGRFKQSVALGGPLLAYSAYPERTTDPIIEEKAAEPPKKEDDLLEFPKEEKEENIPEDVEVSEETVTTDDLSEDGDTNNRAIREQSNMYAGLIDNDSLTRIEGYKDVIRQIMGSGDESQNMQSMAMLMQLGSALMSGKSMDRGLKGFMDIIGQAGMQTAPTLFQMGVEKGKADREIGAAALNMYMSELDKSQNRSGPFSVAYENVYKTNDKGELMYNDNGDPIVDGRRRVGTYYRNSPEIQNLMNINSQLGFDKFTFIDTTATKEGIAAGAPGGGSATFVSESAKDAQLKYAKYVKRGLDTMADYIMPLLIEKKGLVSGALEQTGRYIAPKVALFNEIFNEAVLSGSGGNMKDFQNEQLALAEDLTVPESAEYTVDMGGQKVGVFLDRGNKYGRNEGAKYAEDGVTLIDAGTPAEYVTWDSMKMMLKNPDRSALMTFETTLGLMLARDRQPTGRMLADVLRRSFAETRLTGFGDSVYTDPDQVIEGYTFIYKQLYNNMIDALDGAGYTSDYELSQTKGLTYAPDAFKIKGIDKFKNSYYQLRTTDTEGIFKHDIPGAEAYGSYWQSIQGGIDSDHEENKKESKNIKQNTLDQLE